MTTTPNYERMTARRQMRERLNNLAFRTKTMSVEDCNTLHTVLNEWRMERAQTRAARRAEMDDE